MEKLFGRKKELSLEEQEEARGVAVVEKARELLDVDGIGLSMMDYWRLESAHGQEGRGLVGDGQKAFFAIRDMVNYGIRKLGLILGPGKYGEMVVYDAKSHNSYDILKPGDNVFLIEPEFGAEWMTRNVETKYVMIKKAVVSKQKPR